MIRVDGVTMVMIVILRVPFVSMCLRSFPAAAARSA
jgi:hypothetical protein